MGDLIPVGTVYYIEKTNETIVGNGLNHFPDTVNMGDLFSTADYNYHYVTGGQGRIGWMVHVKDKNKRSYAPLLEEINGKPLIFMTNAFEDCVNMEVAPQIPDCVQDMILAFSGCVALKEPPELPISLHIMNGVFMNCRNLTRAPCIPVFVLSMDYAFQGCTSVTGTLFCNVAGSSIRMGEALQGTQITEIRGTCSEQIKKRLLKTAKH